MITTHDSKPPLVFVYNAGSGLFNAVSDMAHKALSPRTYQCKLCALTHSAFGMRNSWKQFLASMERPVEFLHADELKSRYDVSGVSLPAVFTKVGSGLSLSIDKTLIDACQTIEDLKRLCEEKLR